MPRNRRSIVLDPAAGDEACAWIEALVPETALDRSDLGASLSDGRVLCALVNAISPGAILKISTMDSKFKRMDNYLDMPGQITYCTLVAEWKHPCTRHRG